MPQRCWYVLVLGVSSRDRKVPSCTGRLLGMGKRNCERPRLHLGQPSFSISVPLPGLPSKEPRLPVLIFCLTADFVLLSDSEPSGCESSQSTGDFNINTSVERVSSGHRTSKTDNYRLVTAEMDRICVRAASDSEPVDYNALLCLQRWVSCSPRGADSVLPQQTLVVLQFIISHI